jgi:hypothetical protein
VGISLFYLIEQSFSEGADYALFIVVYDILEELIDKLDFKVGQIEACIIVTIELIRNIQNYFVFFIFISGVHKSMN